MRVPPPQPAARRCKPLLRSPGIGIAQRLGDAGDARVEDEAVHVGELGAQRTRQAQVEEAVQAHRAADVERAGPGAGARGAAAFQAEPQRRSAAGDALPDGRLQVEAPAALRRASRRSCRCFMRRAKRRISASMARASLGPVEVAKVRRRERSRRGSRRAARRRCRRRRRRCRRWRRSSPGSLIVRRCPARGRAARSGVAGDEDGLVRRQEVGVEQAVEAAPLVAAAAQQRLQAPAQDARVEHAGR